MLHLHVYQMLVLLLKVFVLWYWHDIVRYVRTVKVRNRDYSDVVCRLMDHTDIESAGTFKDNTGTLVEMEHRTNTV
jgi:hypothetical protein